MERNRPKANEHAELRREEFGEAKAATIFTREREMTRRKCQKFAQGIPVSLVEYQGVQA